MRSRSGWSSAGRAHLVLGADDLVPHLDEEADVGLELLPLHAVGDGADDEAGALRAHAVHQLAQAAPLAVALDAARDADVVDGGHEDQVAAGDGDVAGDAGPLGADGVLGDLDDDLLPFLEQVLDVLLLAGAALLVAAVAVVAVPAAAAAPSRPPLAVSRRAPCRASRSRRPRSPRSPRASRGAASGRTAIWPAAGAAPLRGPVLRRWSSSAAGTSGAPGTSTDASGAASTPDAATSSPASTTWVRGMGAATASAVGGSASAAVASDERLGDAVRRGQLGRGNVGRPGDVDGLRRGLGVRGRRGGTGGLDRRALLGRGLGGGRPLPPRPGAVGGGDDLAGQRLHLLLLGLLLGGDLGHLLGVLTLGELELLGEVRVAVDVAHVEEGGLLEADVHEGGLHAGKHPDHAPLVDVADDPLLALSLEVVLVDRAALDQGHARLRAGRVDHQDAVARHVGPRLPGPDVGKARPVSGRERGRPGGAGGRGSPVELVLTFAFPAPGGVAVFATLCRALEFVSTQASA